MKKIIAIIVCLLAGATVLSAQSTLYIIDNETVENFDGSQLKGKTIKEYKITTSGTGRNAITVHSISTSPSIYSVYGSFQPLSVHGTAMLDSLQNNIWQSNFQNILDLQRKVLDSLDVNDFKNIQIVPKRIVYVIDGEKYEDGANAFSTLSPSDIKNITVLGEDSAEKLKYGENCTVILIETKRKNRK